MTADPTKTPAPTSFRDLIGRWRRTQDFARDAGCSPLLVRQWRHRNFVPSQYWAGIVAGARRRQIGGVDADVLLALAASVRGGAERQAVRSQPAADRSKVPANREKRE